MPPFEIKPGQILLFRRRAFDLYGYLISQAEGDTDVTHAAWVGANGKSGRPAQKTCCFSARLTLKNTWQTSATLWLSSMG